MESIPAVAIIEWSPEFNEKNVARAGGSRDGSTRISPTADAVPPQAAQVKSAVRTLEVLEFLATHEGSHSLTSMQRALGYPKSSLHALTRTLVQRGWVETDASGNLYRIGIRALLVGVAYIDTDVVVQLSRDTLDWLAEETGETVHLARLDRTDVVYLSTRTSKHFLRPGARAGRRMPAYATSLGKALLAERSNAEVEEMLPDRLEPLTPNTIVNRRKLLADLRATRARGYAIDLEENTLGLRCLGAALRVESPPIYAISLSVPVARMTKEHEEEMVASLLHAGERLRALILPGLRAL